MNDGFQVTFLGGDQRETLTQVKAHLMPKNGQRTGAGPVFLACTRVTNVTH